ncbi:DUF808 family protein [Deinococcus sp. Marseille-Q6407]|uniref:DUF808 family protein n=1 Tax=Deinococcus sp. Marseille-Q6407 TaxID=2969223 RepID=UPI0028FC2D6B|nr:DUF808 family protein [Deinococcus sp. Marseille-Q6407]
MQGATYEYAAFGGGHAHAEEDGGEAAALSSEEHERQMVAGAIRTDLILSAEIMAIALAEVADQPLFSRALILIAVALLITALVYGVVGLIVKMDDIGLKLSQSSQGATAAFGRGLVRAMPHVLTALSVIGTAAMLWVGGHIIVDGLARLGFPELEHLLHSLEMQAGQAVPAAHALMEWLAGTVGSGLLSIPFTCGRGAGARAHPPKSAALLRPQNRLDSAL